ncbi:MAG: glycosyltransferase family 2 protein [Nitrospira sp.]|nr:glycosyltransferase family 2 protein [Nitrospira sp.]
MKLSERWHSAEISDPYAIRGGGHFRWFRNRAVLVVQKEGMGALLRRIGNKIKRVLRGESALLPFESTDLNIIYQQWHRHHSTPGVVLENMLKELVDTGRPPHIDLLIKLSHADAGLVAMALQSLCAQVYPHWKLVLWSPGELDSVLDRVVRDFAERDHRIAYQQELPLRAGCGAWSTILGSSCESFVAVMGQHDELAPQALCVMSKRIVECPRADAVYSDQDSITPEGRHCDPKFKPGWSPDLLLSMNYIDSLCLFRRTTLEAMGVSGPFRLQGVAYSLLLQIAERDGVIEHVPEVLYHRRRSSPAMQDAVPESEELSAHVSTVEAALMRRGERGAVTCKTPGRVEIDRQPSGTPLVSILIPTRDGGDLFRRCIESLESKTTYRHYEIIVLDNGSADSRTLAYLSGLTKRWRVIRCPGGFNFSSMNNTGVGYAKGEYLLFMNDDIEVRSGEWLKGMLAHAQRRGVGAVGAKLLYPDGSIQHAGVVVGIQGIAGHAFRHQPDDGRSYCGLADTVRNCSAVTAACMMVPKHVFTMVRGFDEQLPVEFNDVDLCLRIHREGYRIVYSPDAVLYHHENATRKGRRSPCDEKRFARQWGKLLVDGDPYYNPNLTLRREDWSLDV